MVINSIFFVHKFFILLLVADTTADNDDYLITEIKTDNTIYFHSLFKYKRLHCMKKYTVQCINLYCVPCLQVFYQGHMTYTY